MKEFYAKIAKSTGLIILIICSVLLFIYGFKVVLLILAGTLFAIFFDGIAQYIHRHIRFIGVRTGKFMGVIMVFLTAFLMIYILYPRVSTQVVELKNDLPKAMSSLEKSLESNEALTYVLNGFSTTFSEKKLPGNIQKIFSSVFGILGDLYIIIFLGFFFLANPKVYTRGIKSLFPMASRSKVTATLNSIERTLKRWLLGKVMSMFLVGILTGIGLYILGIPLALTLAIVASITTFIPNIGPLIALIPALLISFSLGSNYAFYTFLLYMGIQAVESNLITPLIQKEMIAFPMALILIAQVILGLFTGYLGLILATPVVAIILLLVKQLYIKDILEKPTVSG